MPASLAGKETPSFRIDDNVTGNDSGSIAPFDCAMGSRLGVLCFAVETPAHLLRIEHCIRCSDPLLREFAFSFEQTLDNLDKLLEFHPLSFDAILDNHDVVEGLLDQTLIEREVILVRTTFGLNQVASDQRSPRPFTHAWRTERRCARCAACFGRLRVALPASLCRS